MTNSNPSFTSSGYLILDAFFSLPSVTFSRESTREHLCLVSGTGVCHDGGDRKRWRAGCRIRTGMSWQVPPHGIQHSLPEIGVLPTYEGLRSALGVFLPFNGAEGLLCSEAETAAPDCCGPLFFAFLNPEVLV